MVMTRFSCFLGGGRCFFFRGSIVHFLEKTNFMQKLKFSPDDELCKKKKKDCALNIQAHLPSRFAKRKLIINHFDVSYLNFGKFLPQLHLRAATRFPNGRNTVPSQFVHASMDKGAISDNSIWCSRLAARPR